MKKKMLALAQQALWMKFMLVRVRKVSVFVFTVQQNVRISLEKFFTEKKTTNQII